MRSSVGPGLALLGLLGWGSSAAAYVLPAPFILKMMADRRERLELKDLTVQLNTEVGEAGAVVEEYWYLKPPERSRRVRQEEEQTVVELQREGKQARGPEGALKLVKGPIADPLPTLLFPAGADLDQKLQRIVAQLKGLGVDTTVSALGRFNGTVCYIIGARSFEADRPQLWLDKETFLPLRLIHFPTHEGKKVRRELRWLEFGSSTTGEFFPRILEVWEAGKRSERAEVEKVEVNTKVPETIFDLPS